ncbi:MAG: hypothetical protein KC731_24160 [Myxococcales bacterium]|nr:hypothetical protein [Myxococcales bacterium]
MRRGRLASVALTGLLLGLLTAACGDGSPPPPSDNRQSVSAGSLEGGVASLGPTASPEVVAPETLQRIAAARGVPVAEALELAIDDALYAAAARSDLPPEVVSRAERRVHAHALLRDRWLDLRSQPITDRELAAFTELRWSWYDRPQGYLTVHFVVEADDKADAATHEHARRLATELRQIVAPIAARGASEPPPPLTEGEMFRLYDRPRDPLESAFIKAIQGADHEGLSVISQPLPPITADGRPIDHDAPLVVSYFDSTYAAASAALTQRGELTPVFKTYAGYHAAMLLRITPEHRASEAERRDELRGEILRRRARVDKEQTVKKLRANTEITEPAKVEALLSLVTIEADRD